MSLEILNFGGLNPAIQEEICHFLDNQCTAHPFQYPQWSARQNSFVLYRQNGSLRWYASCAPQYPLGSRVPFCNALSINRGPVCDHVDLWRDVFDEFTRSINKKYVYVDCSPDRIESLDLDTIIFRHGVWNCMGPKRSSLRLDLRSTPDELFSAFRKNTRYEVRRAERLGVNVRIATSDADVTNFLGKYLDLAKRKGFSPDAPEHLSQILFWLRVEQERGALLLGEYDGMTVGGAVIVRAGNRCWYVWGASQKQKDFNVGHILQWNALLWAKSHRCTEYDFGGYTPGATSGPAWFKQGFGGTPVDFVPPHRGILRPTYARIIHLASRFH
jgi:Acetyltransferase (GNAT) domain